MPAWLYRFGPASAALALFLAMSWLYWDGAREVYGDILRSWGVVPFRTPFLDTGFVLAAWDCTRRGWDVTSYNPCDLLHLPFIYSPFWLTASRIPLGVGDTAAVGWALDLLFIASLCLLPPPQRFGELMLVLAATVSTMVVFALERANADILLFMLALATGLLAGRGPIARIIGYGLALSSALLKYYPLMVLIVVFRQRIAVFAAVAAAAAVSLAVFWAAYHVEIARGLANVPTGPYNTDLFAAKNLPFLIGLLVEKAAEPSRAATALGWAVTAGLYAGLVGAALAICRRLSRLPELSAAIAELSDLERILMVIGSAVIAGCFFAGQSIGYRGIFLLLVMPGLLALSRSAAPALRILCLGTAIVVVLLMWGEGLRLALGGGFGFWLLRELGWWWSVSVMLTLVGDFLRESPILRGAAAWLGRGSGAVAVTAPEAVGQRRDRGPRGGRGPRYC
jgi:hypothetical protein